MNAMIRPQAVGACKGPSILGARLLALNASLTSGGLSVDLPPVNCRNNMHKIPPSGLR
jgi:hypothetical protein